MPPNRWLHLRNPAGFTPEAFERFRAHCRVFRAYVEAVLKDWHHFERSGSGTAPVGSRTRGTRGVSPRPDGLRELGRLEIPGLPPGVASSTLRGFDSECAFGASNPPEFRSRASPRGRVEASRFNLEG